MCILINRWDKYNKYNSAYHRTIKIKPVDIKPKMYIDFDKKNNKEGPKFKVGGNVRISYKKVSFHIGLRKFLWLEKLKILYREHMLLVTWTENKLLEPFTKNNCKKQIKESLELKR